MTVEATRLTIRPMTSEDIAALARALGGHEPGITHRWRRESSDWHEMFVALLDGSPVGSVNVDVKEELPRHLHLYALGVQPEFQRRGIGGSLVARVEEEAAARDYEGIFLDVGIDNDDARRLYERLGYAVEGEAFGISWQRVNEDGTMGAVVSDTVYRMFKRFPEA